MAIRQLTDEDYAAIAVKVDRSMKAMERRGAKKLAEAARVANRDDVQIMLEQYRPHCGHKDELLMPRATYDAMPRIHAGGANPLVGVKFFTPDSNWTWYATEVGEVRGDDGKLLGIEFFGLVDGQYPELGYFNLSEIGRGRGRLGLPIERDFHWTPVELRLVQRQVEEKKR